MGAAANLSLLLLPSRVQEQVPVPVFLRLHVVIVLLRIIVVHDDGARVLGAGVLPGETPGGGGGGCPGVEREWSRVLGWADGAGLAPLRPDPPRRCLRRLLLEATAAAGALEARGAACLPACLGAGAPT